MSKEKDLRLNFTIDFDGMLKLSNNNKEWIGQLIKYLKIVSDSILECPEHINCIPSDCDFVIEHINKTEKETEPNDNV